MNLLKAAAAQRDQNVVAWRFPPSELLLGRPELHDCPDLRSCDGVFYCLWELSSRGKR